MDGSKKGDTNSLAPKSIFVVLLSFLSLGAVGYGLHQAVHSTLFTLQSIQVESSVDDPPLSEATIVRLAAVPLGKVNLFDIDLNMIERRLLMFDSIKEVSLQKKIPKTLQIAITYRVPKAIVQSEKGGLSYVDSEGKVFGTLNLMTTPDLPHLSGFSKQSPERICGALQLIQRWESSPLAQFAMVSSVHWDSERGYRVLATYSMSDKILASPRTFNTRIRSLVDFGQNIDPNLDGKLFQLSKVFRYLSGNAIAARQILADAGKKIVVKTAHGS